MHRSVEQLKHLIILREAQLRELRNRGLKYGVQYKTVVEELDRLRCQLADRRRPTE